MSAVRSISAAEATIRAPDPASRRLLVDAADARIELAREPSAGRRVAASFSLLREASVLLLQAVAADRGELEAWSLEEALLDPPGPSVGLRALLADRDLLAVDKAPNLTELRDELEGIVLRLRASVDPRTTRQRAFDRVRASILLVALLSVLFATFGMPLLRGKNLALHKKVTTSTMPGGDPSFDTLVDGKLHDPFAVATKADRPSFIQVDLQASHRLSFVRVLARRDCCWTNDLPWALEISEDGKSWNVVSEKKTEFHPNDPWEVSLSGRSARYVRVRSIVPGTVVALSSLEVHGR